MTIARAPRHSVLAVALLAVAAAAGCGWVQVPASGTDRLGTAKPAPDPTLASARVVPRAPPPEPAGVPAVPSAPPGNVVRAGPGDTVYALSRRHGVPVDTIISLNALPPPYHLVVGQRVTLWRDGEHVVRDGETLDSVSRAYRVDRDALASVNGLTASNALREGQTLRIPDAAASPVPPSGPATPVSVVARTPPPPPPVPSPPAVETRGFIWPVEGTVVSGFGRKTKGLHNDGINIEVARGTDVVASQSGVVAYAGNELRGFGNMLLIKHADGWVTAYAHNEALLVGRGDTVRKGQVIAKVGTSGSVTKPQLHFELRKGKKPVDPLKYLGKGSV